MLFGLFHPISLTYMVIAAILGLYLGAVLIVGGNLLTSWSSTHSTTWPRWATRLRIRARSSEADGELVMIFPGATAMLELGLEWILLRERTKGCRKRLPGSHARPGARGASDLPAQARLVPGLLVFFFCAGGLPDVRGQEACAGSSGRETCSSTRTSRRP